MTNTRIKIEFGTHNGEKYYEVCRYDFNEEVTKELAYLIHEYLTGNEHYISSDIVLNRNVKNHKVTLIVIGEPTDMKGVAAAIDCIHNYRIGK